MFQSNLYVRHHLFNPLNTELNPICHLLALLGAHHILHVGRIRVKRVCATNAGSFEMVNGVTAHREHNLVSYWCVNLKKYEFYGAQNDWPVGY